VAQGLCRLRGKPNRDFVDVDIRGLLDGRLRRIDALFGPGLMVSASSVFTAPGQIVVTRILLPASCRRPAEIARAANLVPE